MDSVVTMVERRRDRSWSMQVIALYDYEPEQPDELDFQEGDVLRVLRVQDDGWWSGFNVESPDVVGLFPSNYVQAQKTVPRVQVANSLVAAVTTSRPPASSRQRIQQQPRRTPDTPELDDEDEGDDRTKELRGEYRGHVGAVLQLRKNLEEAQRASEAVKGTRREGERERLRHRKSWREQEQGEEGVEVKDMNQKQVIEVNYKQQKSLLGNGNDTEDEDDSAFPQLQGYMHETDRQQTQEDEASRKEENEIEAGEGYDYSTATADAENAAVTLIARAYRRHATIVQTSRKREREAEQQQLNEIAAVCIQRWAIHAHSRQCKRRQRELERSTARRRWQQENEAATSIQKWIRMRWACFWRRRVQIERQTRIAREAQQVRQLEEMMKVERHQAELDKKLRREAENECRIAYEKEKYEQLGQKAEKEEKENRRVLHQKLEDEEQQLRQLQLKTIEEEVQRRFLQAEAREEDGTQHDTGPVVPFENAQAPSPGKLRRKVMKKEAVELIKTLVQQQLGETLRDHDAKMDELQRMVARLQTVVRKQSTMLEDSTDQLVNLQQERRLPMPQRSNDAGSCSFLPRINRQSSVSRQPVAPSGLRAPRPVILSKLPVLSSGKRETNGNLSKKR